MIEISLKRPKIVVSGQLRAILSRSLLIRARERKSFDISLSNPTRKYANPRLELLNFIHSSIFELFPERARSEVRRRWSQLVRSTPGHIPGLTERNFVNFRNVRTSYTHTPELVSVSNKNSRRMKSADDLWGAIWFLKQKNADSKEHARARKSESIYFDSWQMNEQHRKTAIYRFSINPVLRSRPFTSAYIFSNLETGLLRAYCFRPPVSLFPNLRPRAKSAGGSFRALSNYHGRWEKMGEGVKDGYMREDSGM